MTTSFASEFQSERLRLDLTFIHHYQIMWSMSNGWRW